MLHRISGGVRAKYLCMSGMVTVKDNAAVEAAEVLCAVLMLKSGKTCSGPALHLV